MSGKESINKDKKIKFDILQLCFLNNLVLVSPPMHGPCSA